MSANILSKALRYIVKNRKSVFAFLVIATLLLSLCRAFFQYGESNRWFLFFDEKDTFMDFFNSIWDSRCENPYVEKGVIYPPLTYVVYRLFGHLIPQSVYAQGSSFALRAHQAGILSFCLYCLISVSFFIFSIWIFSRKWDKKPWLLIITILLSSPVLYSFERGNLVLPTVALLLIYLSWYDSENKKKREIAIIALAISANIKIFPAVFGLLLLQKKRWKEAVRCVLYAIILLVVPMLFFGGLSNIQVLIHNILSTSDGFESINRTRVDIGNIFRVLSDKSILPSLFSMMATLTLPLGAIILCVTCCFIEEEWKKVLTLTLICVALPGFSWLYNLVYFIPAIIFCVYEDRRNWKQWIYYTLLLIMFLYYPLNVFKVLPISIDNTNYTYRLWDILSTICNLLLTFMVIIDGVFDGIVIGHTRIQFKTKQSRFKNKDRILFQIK